MSGGIRKVHHEAFDADGAVVGAIYDQEIEELVAMLRRSESCMAAFVVGDKLDVRFGFRTKIEEKDVYVMHFIETVRAVLDRFEEDHLSGSDEAA